MVEVVGQIKNAEAQADEIKKSARGQVRTLHEEAVISGKKLVDTQRDNALKQASDMLAQAQTEAQAYLQQRGASSAEACEQLGGEAQAKLEKAAGYIAERIVERL